MIIDQSWGLSN